MLRFIKKRYLRHLLDIFKCACVIVIVVVFCDFISIFFVSSSVMRRKVELLKYGHIVDM